MIRIIVLGSVNAIGIGGGFLDQKLELNNILEFDHIDKKYKIPTQEGKHFDQGTYYNTKDLNKYRSNNSAYYLAYFLSKTIPDTFCIISCGDYNGWIMNDFYINKAKIKILEADRFTQFVIKDTLVLYFPDILDFNKKFEINYVNFKNKFCDIIPKSNWYIIPPKMDPNNLPKKDFFKNDILVPNDKFIDIDKDVNHLEFGYYSNIYAEPKQKFDKGIISTYDLIIHASIFISTEYKKNHQPVSLIRVLEKIFLVILVLIFILIGVKATFLTVSKILNLDKKIHSYNIKQLINNERDKIKRSDKK